MKDFRTSRAKRMVLVPLAEQRSKLVVCGDQGVQEDEPFTPWLTIQPNTVAHRRPAEPVHMPYSIVERTSSIEYESMGMRYHGVCTTANTHYKMFFFNWEVLQFLVQNHFL